MGDPAVNVSALPASTRAAFQELAQLLLERAGDDLLGLSAFGGWLVEDPLFARSPARSVAVFQRFDLPLLDQLAKQGVRLGRRGLRAPLIMTPEYIAASRDAFPLEFLEIQQAHVLVCGTNCFAGVTFEPRDVRLQCERELKSELIQLRQGLLAAAGDRRPLAELCQQATERVMRVLRGLLHSQGAAPPQRSSELVVRAAEATGLPLEALRRAVGEARRVDFEAFARFYDDLKALADYVNALP